MRICHPLEVSITVTRSRRLLKPISLIDYIAVSGTMERNVLEYVDHLHEHFLYPCSINSNGRYNVPSNDKEGYRCVVLLRVLAPFNSPLLQYRDAQVFHRRVRVAKWLVLGEGEVILSLGLCG